MGTKNMHHYLVSNINRQYGYVYKIIYFISVLRYQANTVLLSYYRAGSATGPCKGERSDIYYIYRRILQLFLHCLSFSNKINGPFLAPFVPFLATFGPLLPYV